MKYFTQKIFALAVFLMLGGIAFSQTAFWSEDFSGGIIPAEWTNADPSGNNALWTWCANPANGQGNGCPAVWNDASNNQVPFAAATATNGFATMDSDAIGDIATDHKSQLTSDTIDCSGQPEVWLYFETQIGVYTIDAEAGAIVKVSKDDGATWTSFTIFPGLTTSERWSSNPFLAIVNISSVAANQANVKIQWEWTGNYEYNWNIDDIALMDGDPTPAYNVSLGQFFYTPGSFAQPISQVKTDTMSFFAEISNIGTSEMTNVVLKARILKADGTELFADSTIIDAIAPGVVDSIFQTDNIFVPNMLTVGDYQLAYTIYSLDNDDVDFGNNSDSAPFVVTDNLYSKEAGPTIAYRPGGGPADYQIGNLYYTSNDWVDTYMATTARWSAAKNAADGNLLGDVVKIILLEVNEDVVDPGWGNFDDNLDFISNPGFTLRSINDHTFANAANFTTENQSLLDFDTELPGVELKPGNRYLLLASYEGDNNVIFHAFSEAIPSVNFFKISTVIWDSGDATWYLGGFGPEPAAHLRMIIDLFNTADEKPLPDNALKYFPNPATNKLNVQLSLEEPTLANVTLADLSGRVILIDEIKNAYQNNLEYNVSNLPAGAYLVRVATKNGTSTKKFVVAR